MSRLSILVLFLMTTFVALTTSTQFAVPQRLTAQNPCSSKTTCSKCIQTPSCAWCYAPMDSWGDNPRCFQPSYPVAPKDMCPEEYVFNPDNEMSVLENRELTRAHAMAGSGGAHWGVGYEASWNRSESWSGSGSFSHGAQGVGAAGGHIVQVAPQRVKLKLRANQSYSIFMSYTQAEDYPVDLYYLMDLSRSMLDDKQNLYKLGDKLAETMNNITSNFTLGFGSFVDKVVMPYVSTLPEKLRRPCDDECVAPYGFKHHMSLSTNTPMFSRMVNQAHVSGNLDAPEGGFDAILQAAVCRHNIGWREQARRLLVFSTDASFHYAGDGKLGGIVKPNDGMCHLDSSGFYTESSYQDYPSIEQINVAVKRNAINVIFAVTKDALGIYERLAKHIEGATVAQLKSDSSNIVELVKKQYEQISSLVHLKHNASSNVAIKFYSRCLNGDNAPLVNTEKCDKIKVGDEVLFKVDLEVVNCPALRKNRFQTIQIYPVGINESMTIDLEMICACECEKPGDKYYKEHAPECNYHGTLKCGVCECEPGSSGRQCQCHGEGGILEANRTNTCVPEGALPGTPECSGRGECVCGVCQCETRGQEKELIYGKYCECDNFSCERHEGQLCSGVTHGHCECGHCVCREGWTGPNCACANRTDTCYMPQQTDAQICSGHGTCECGQCVCDEMPEGGRYSGQFCQLCPTCSNRCLEFKDCVQCQQYKTGPLKDLEDCLANCTKVPVPIAVKEIVATDNEILCPYYDEDECRFVFTYGYDKEGQLRIRAQEERECPHPVYVPGIVLGVIAAIVLVGMAILLLWKLLTTIHDRREFARFEKERMMAKWDTGENPIYKQATSTFKNPTYAGKG